MHVTSRKISDTVWVVFNDLSTKWYYSIIWRWTCIVRVNINWQSITKRINNKNNTHNHFTALLEFVWPELPGWAGTRKVKTRKVKPIWTYWSNREWAAVASAGPHATLTPFDLLQGLPCGRHMGSPPILYTRRVPPCMAQSRLGAFPR